MVTSCSMADPARRNATYDDLLRAPNHLLAELVGGELITSPHPGAAHGIAASATGGSLVPPFQFGDGGPGGWWILPEPEIHVDADVLVPDLAGWRRERMPGPPSGPYIGQPPDWVCEILSPSTARLDRVRKLPIYAHWRVGHAWLIDPETRTLELFRLQADHWLLLGAYADAARVRAEPFDAVEIDLFRLWGGA
jgi:Uma2 family endonuclease